MYDRRKKPSYAQKRSFKPVAPRVNPADVKKEMKEHPWASKEIAERIAADHACEETQGEFYPKSVKTDEERQLYQFFKIHPAGSWSAELLNTTEAGKILAEGHWTNVKKMIAENPPKSKTAVQQLQKKAVQTPQQQFVIMHEASSVGPLSAEGFSKYMTLFQGNFPKQYASVYGSKSPDKLTAECVRQQARMQ